MTTREKRAMCITIPGTLFVAWRIYAVLAGAGPAAASAGQATPASPESAAPPMTSASQCDARAQADTRLARQAELDKAEWTRDPFAPPEVPRPDTLPVASQKTDDGAPAPPALRFTGVSEVKGKLVALLGGKLVRKGMVLEGGIEVTDITARTVVLRSGRWSFHYRLGQTAVQTRPVGPGTNAPAGLVGPEGGE